MAMDVVCKDNNVSFLGNLWGVQHTRYFSQVVSFTLPSPKGLKREYCRACRRGVKSDEDLRHTTRLYFYL